MKWDNTDKNGCRCVKVKQYCKLAALSVEKVDQQDSMNDTSETIAIDGTMEWFNMDRCGEVL